MNLRLRSTQLKNFWAKKVENNHRKKTKSMLENQSFGLMVSSLYQHTPLKEGPTINSYLLGKTVKVYLKKRMSEDKFMFMTYFRILKSPNFQFNVVRHRKYWLSPLQLGMQPLSGLKILLTHQVKATMESMHANTFSCKEVNLEYLYQYLME